jgi:hypothetical protein
VRSEDLDFAFWRRSDSQGINTFELPEDPVTLVALWKGNLTVKKFDRRFADQLKGKNLLIQLK